MNLKIVCFIVCIVAVESLRFSSKRPSTAWGVQKKVFRRELDKEFFRSKDGTYQFEFDSGNGQHQIFRRERRFFDGTIVGFYGYIDPSGALRITEYTAGRLGYKERNILRYPV